MDRFRLWLNSPVGRAVCGVTALIVVGVVVWSVVSAFGGGDAAAISAERTFVCAETGKAFSHTVAEGEAVPVMSPFSSKNTGYLPDATCFWAADGKIKDVGTPVLLNSTLKQPGPTFCPECGRLVVADQGLPEPGAKPPATKTEYAAGKR